MRDLGFRGQRIWDTQDNENLGPFKVDMRNMRIGDKSHRE